jgi:hypothetical protein
MVGPQGTSVTEPETDTETTRAQDHGWYLFGVTLRGLEHSVDTDIAADRDGEGRQVQLLECGDLRAVIRPVLLEEFSAEALAARAADPVWLEATVRSHNDVIAAVHRVQTILPAKFGAVYASQEDLSAALADADDALQAQLRRLEGADEWAVHIYAERTKVASWAASESPGVDQIQRELADARPGRAYFLKRKLADELATATDRAFSDLAQTAFDELAAHALAGQINPLAREGQGAKDEVEILRAAFLVPRTGAESFLDELRAIADSRAGLAVDYSGPWPPYSFAAFTKEAQ